MNKLITLAFLFLAHVAHVAHADIVSSDANGQISVQTVRADNICINNSGAGSCGTMRGGLGVSGRVGIGTTTPATLLDVNGAAQFGATGSKSGFDSSGNLTLASGASLTGTIPNTVTSSFTIAAAGSVDSLLLKSANGTGGIWMKASNTGGNSFWGNENSAGNDVLSGGLAYSAFIGAGSGRAIQLAPNGNVVSATFLGTNLGLGTAFPADKLHISSPTANVIIDGLADGFGLQMRGQLTNRAAIHFSNNVTGSLSGIYASNTKDMQFYTNGEGNLAIDLFPSGNVGINLISADITTATLHVNGSGIFDGNLVQKTLKSCTTGTQTDANGLFSACVASDVSLKKNITSYAYDPLAIDKLRAVTYSWKNPAPRDARKHLGFIAQEVEKVYPDAVVAAGVGLKGIDSNAMIAALVIEVQQLRKRVAVLEKK